MARISFLVVMAVFFAAGCTTIKEKIRLADFQEVSKAYEHVMLNSDFESAYGFTNSDLMSFDRKRISQHTKISRSLNIR